MQGIKEQNEEAFNDDQAFDQEYLRKIELNKARFGGLHRYLRKNLNLFADAKRVRMNKNPIFKSKENADKRMLKRSVTSVIPKNSLKQQQAQFIKRKPILESKPMPIDPIIFQLQSKQTPLQLNYTIKRLKSNTLLFKSEKGLLHCSFDPSYSTQARNRKNFPSYSHENSDQLLLSTENTLYDYYNQSIRLQRLIKRKEIEKKLDWNSYCSLSNKLSAINKNIVNEHSRIAKSFYSM